MNKILYLHGLESSQGGDKVDFLTQNNLVFTPKIDYTENDTFNKLLSYVKEINPHYIIGSSIGGRYAYYLSSFIPTKTLFLNPAIYNFDPLPKGEYDNQHTFILGLKDDIVNPNTIIEKHTNSTIFTLPNVGHRISISDFVNIYHQIINLPDDKFIKNNF